jgi:hypothetical protein
MLHHETTGPDAAGEYRFTYHMPGCAVPTVVCAGMRSADESEAAHA